MRSKYPSVTVYWVDTVSCDPWRSPEDLEDDETLDCITKGFLVRESEREVVVAGTVGADGNFFGTAAIPRGMILRIVRK